MYLYLLIKNKTTALGSQHKTKKKKFISKTIDYPFPKEETLKIPISLCKNYNEYSFDLTKCYYLKYEPISIEYNNKYLFSKQNIKIREYKEHTVIMDGEPMGGKGSA